MIYILFNDIRYAQIEAQNRGINPLDRRDVVMVRNDHALRGRRLAAGDQILDLARLGENSTARQHNDREWVWRQLHVMAAAERLTLDSTLSDGIWTYTANPKPEASTK